MKEKHPVKKIIRKYIWDFLLTLILLGFMGFFYFRLYTFAILPTKWMLVLLLIFVLIWAILMLLNFIRIKKWIMWCKRVFIVILCGLLAYTGFLIGKAEQTTKKVTTAELYSRISIAVITKNDASISKISDLSNSKIALQTGNDKAVSTFAKKKLKAEKTLSGAEYTSYEDYSSMMTALLNGEADAIIMPENKYTQYIEDNEVYTNGTKIIKRYVMKQKNQVSTSKKDIRYETFTVYLTGIDDVGSPDQNTRSDVNMLLVVSPQSNHIEMISIPRDSFVPNPALGNVNDKLTHTGNDGPENTVEAMEQVLGIDIDFYVKMSFTSVIDIIDAIGGIEVDVPISFCEQDENRSFEAKDLICLNPGKQKLNGKQALALARHRHSYTDIQRTEAQQKVIEGVVNKLISIASVSNANKLLDILPNLIKTNMPMDQITNFISYQLDHLKKWSFDSITLSNGSDGMLMTASYGAQPLYVYLLNYDDIQKVLDKYAELNSSMNFKKFGFDLQNLNKNRLTPPKGITWAGSDTSAYADHTPAEPETPTTQPTTPSEEPSNPETPNNGDQNTPTDPDSGNTPENPDDGSDTPPDNNGSDVGNNSGTN